MRTRSDGASGAGRSSRLRRSSAARTLFDRRVAGNSSSRSARSLRCLTRSALLIRFSRSFGVIRSRCSAGTRCARSPSLAGHPYRDTPAGQSIPTGAPRPARSRPVRMQSRSAAPGPVHRGDDVDTGHPNSSQAATWSAGARWRRSATGCASRRPCVRRRSSGRRHLVAGRPLHRPLRRTEATRGRGLITELTAAERLAHDD
jgi:hypothetical protein